MKHIAMAADKNYALPMYISMISAMNCCSNKEDLQFILLISEDFPDFFVELINEAAFKNRIQPPRFLSMKDSFEDDKKVEIFYATIKASEVVQEKEKIDEKVETKTETEANSSVTEEVNVPQKDDSKELKTAIQELAAIMFVTKTVNVRATPSLDGEKVGSLSLNDEVNVTGKTDDGWYRIQYGDGEAYVKEGFFANSRTELPTQTSVVNSETADTTTVTSSSNNSDSGDHVVVPTQADTEGNLVWVPTNGGKKYHSKPTCSGMIDPIQVTLEHAEENGYTACQKCH